jgi:hypothetical protein
MERVLKKDKTGKLEQLDATERGRLKSRVRERQKTGAVDAGVETTIWTNSGRGIDGSLAMFTVAKQAEAAVKVLELQ